MPKRILRSSSLSLSFGAKKFGSAGLRSPYLSHAKRTNYQLFHKPVTGLKFQIYINHMYINVTKSHILQVSEIVTSKVAGTAEYRALEMPILLKSYFVQIKVVKPCFAQGKMNVKMQHSGAHTAVCKYAGKAWVTQFLTSTKD